MLSRGWGASLEPNGFCLDGLIPEAAGDNDLGEVDGGGMRLAFPENLLGTQLRAASLIPGYPNKAVWQKPRLPSPSPCYAVIPPFPERLKAPSSLGTGIWEWGPMQSWEPGQGVQPGGFPGWTGPAPKQGDWECVSHRRKDSDGKRMLVGTAVCAFVSVCVRVFERLCLCVSVYVRRYVFTCVSVYVCMHIWRHVYLYVWMWIYLCVCVRARALCRNRFLCHDCTNHWPRASYFDFLHLSFLSCKLGIYLLWRLNELKTIKCLGKCLAHAIGEAAVLFLIGYADGRIPWREEPVPCWQGPAAPLNLSSRTVQYTTWTTVHSRPASHVLSGKGYPETENSGQNQHFENTHTEAFFN